MHLLLRRVRSFSDPIPARIAPLTILVGENSSGKSSFLALLRIAHSLAIGGRAPNFNREPFMLGAFDQIAHYRGGSYGRAKSFEIGFQFDLEPYKGKAIDAKSATFIATFEKEGSQPCLSSTALNAGLYKWKTFFSGDKVSKVQISAPNWKDDLPSNFLDFLLGTATNTSSLNVAQFYLKAQPTLLMEKFKIDQSTISALLIHIEVLEQIRSSLSSALWSTVYAGAPVRTEPRRTYNPVDETPNAEGDHVPMVLAKAKYKAGLDWTRVSNSLSEFGQASGLFQTLGVRTLGKNDSDPFQLEVRLGGPARNIIDVGYGVSQVLPIIVDLLEQRRSNRIYLLQQPEVHLHPRAQAALGEFLVHASKQGDRSIVVETHSDYLIDRIRMMIRDEKAIKPEDVSILFFERDASVTKVYELGLDDHGNWLDVPPSYRAFFERESDRLLGIR